MSRLKQLIEARKFVVTCELTPPKGTNLDPLFEKAAMLSSRVNAFNLTDSHAARMAMDPIAVAHLMLDRGFEPIVQMTSRDKNRIALQAAMLGASALGVENLAFMGGDSPKNGDHPEAKPVFDLFASQLLEAVSALQSGTDYMGNPLNGAPNFYVGAVFNPGASNLELEIENLHRKIDAGASFLQTQAVYNVDDFVRFVDKAGSISVPVLAGIIPIKSVKMAKYMNNNIPGISIPEHLIRKIEDQGDDAQGIANTSVDISIDIVKQLQPSVGGLHMMAIGWEDKIPAILDGAGITT